MKKDQAKYKISPKGKRKLDFPKKTKSSIKLPLISKTVYLDVKDVKCTKKLETDLKKLGATIEEFVSKDINYLITSQPRPKIRRDPDDLSPTPSPFNCDPSPSPGSVDDRNLSTVTRGRAIAEKARIHTKAPTSTLLDNAEKWGVKIVTLEVAFKWIDKELKKLPKSPQSVKANSSRLKSGVSHHKTFKAPFLKLEADTHIYRPCTSQLEAWPRLNVDTPRGSCPFDGTLIAVEDRSREERGEILAAQVDVSTPDTPQEEKDEILSGARTKSMDKSVKKSESDVFGSSRLLTAGELRRQREVKRRQERKRGYCECCHVKYEDLDKHVRDNQHREYVRDKSHFEHLDRLIRTAPSPADFLKKETMKALLQRPSKQPSSEDEDEVLLIPTTPKTKQDNNSNKISLVSPLKQANINVKRITPKRKSSDVGRKKSTPSGDVKNSFRVTKFRKEIKSRSPKKGTSPKVSLSATSPRTRSVSNTPVHVREKVSPKKIPEEKYDVKSKLKSPGKSYKKSTAVLFDAENDMTTQKNICHITDSYIDDLDEVLQSRVTDKQLPLDVKKSSQTKVQVRFPIKEVQDHNKVRKSIDYNKDDNFNRNEKQNNKEEKGIGSSPGALSVTGSRTRITSTSVYSTEKVSPRKVPNLKSDCKSKLDSPVTNYSTKTKSSSLVFGVEYSTKARKHISHVSKYDIDSLQSRLTDKQSPTDNKLAVKSPKLTTNSQAKSPAKDVQNYKSVKKSIDYGKDNSFHKNEKQIINQIDSETILKDSIAATIPLPSEFNVTASSEKGEGTLSTKHRSSRQMPDKEKKNKVSDTEVVAKDFMSLATTSVSENSMPEEKHTQSLKGIHKYEPEQVNGSSVADRSKALEQDKGKSNGKLKPTNLNPTENTLETNVVLEQMDGESKKKTISKSNTAHTEENSFTLDYTSTEKIIIKKAFEQVIDSGLAKKQQKLKTQEHENNHLNALSNIGERTSECKSSSDDFEKCILNAISHGDLIYKKASDDAETDRVLRSRNSLGLQYSVETDDQICQKISGNIDNNDAPPLELEEATDSSINKGTFKQSLKHDKSTEGLTLVKPELSIKPGNETKETCDFDLPLDLLDEVLFSPTLAERVKARTRCSPANSYNVSPARSRSNSVSSNQSDSSTTRVRNNLATKSILNRAKTQLLQEKNCVKNFRCKKKGTRRDTSNEVQLKKQHGDFLEPEDSPNCQPKTHMQTNEEIETVDDGIKLVKSENNQKIRKYLGDTVRQRKRSFDSQELKYNGINKSDFKKLNQSTQATTEQVCEEYSLKNRNIGKISPQCSETSSMQSSEAVFVENFAKVNHQKGSDSPVFTASPVAKRRKSKSRNIKTATDQVLNDKIEQKEQIVKTNQSLSISMDTNFLSGSKDRVKRNSVSGKERSSKNKTKSKGRVIRISQSIRDSLLENTSPAGDKIQGSDKVDECSSESVSNQSKGDDSNLSTASKPTTPNCKKVVPSSCYGSGYSSTPRDDRRKAWARKNKAEESLKSNNCKRRKLEKLKFIIPDNTPTSENSSLKTLDQLRGMSPIKSAKINASKKTCAQKEILQNKKKDLGGSSQLEVKENKLNSNESFSLKWEYLPDSKNTVKLKESWSLLSNRSVSKLLSSEDGAESFDGFTEEDINTTVSVASDLSYEEHWEVDKSINSEREFDVDIVQEKADEVNKEEFEQFLPIFSSPNKNSDSSWVDACEGYIDKSIKSTENLVYRGWTSPRKKVYNKDTEVENFYMSPSKSPQSPRINKRIKRPISNSVFDREKVDEEIDFNFRSPQKDRSQFSPLKVKNGKVVDTSSPHCKTSTPRQLRYNKDL